MLYSLLSFFGLSYFLPNLSIWYKIGISCIIFIIDNTKYIKQKPCGCDKDQKPQKEI
jgi:hypothetical protein